MLLLTLERGCDTEPLRKFLYLQDMGFDAEDAAAIMDLKKHPSRLGDVWQQVQDDDDYDGQVFLEALEHVAYEAMFCNDCEEVAWSDDCTRIYDGSYVCDNSCLQGYSCCEGCSDWVDQYDIRDVDSTYFCENCVSSYCSWCDECDEYYHDDYSDDHDHNSDCDCEPPRPQFTFPDGQGGTVRENERLRVTLPAGTISEVGINEIRAALMYANPSLGTAWDIFHVIESLSPEWQKKDGNYTRRLSRAVYKQLNVKVPNALLSEIGNIARRHTSDTSSYQIEFTRDLNGSAEDFYNEDSCWWTSHAFSRCALKNWGGIGLRSYYSEDYNSDCPNGRVWVQPLDANLHPTHSTVNARAFIVYNGYGKLDSYAPARIVAHLTGLTYRKIPLNLEPQYVNGKTGYLVADEVTCKATNELKFSADQHMVVGNFTGPDTLATTNQEVAV